MIGDLHCHSKLSDGSCGLEDLVFYSKRAGLDVLAVTDHDTIAGVSRAQVLGKRYGISIIPGVELSCKDPETGRRVHLLCYFPQEPQRLEGLLHRTQNSRKEAGLKMLERLMTLYPVTKEHVFRYSASSSGIFKVHLMQALLDLGYDKEIYGKLYHQLFDSSSPSCIKEAVDYPTGDEGLEAIRSAKGLAVLAHPSVYRSMELLERLAKEGRLDGVELYHPRNTAEDQEHLRQIAAGCGLLTTGGTDFHGSYSSDPNPLATCISTQRQLQALYQAAQQR